MRILGINKESLPSLLLRLGLAFVFGYAAISSLLSPNDWIGYLPKILTTILPSDALLKGMSIYEIALAGWLLVGRQTQYAAIVAALTLAGITVTNIGLIVISFRDIGLTFAALALASMEWNIEEE